MLKASEEYLLNLDHTLLVKIYQFQSPFQNQSLFTCVRLVIQIYQKFLFLEFLECCEFYELGQANPCPEKGVFWQLIRKERIQNPKYPFFRCNNRQSQGILGLYTSGWRCNRQKEDCYAYLVIILGVTFARAKISQLNCIILDENIFRLDVSMKNSLLMHVVNGLENLVHDDFNAFVGQWALLALETLVEVHLHKLENQGKFACITQFMIIPLGQSQSASTIFIIFQWDERMFRACIYFSFFTFSTESNFFFMHFIATCFPVFSESAVKTTEKVPLPFQYYNLYWSITFTIKIQQIICNSSLNNQQERHYIKWQQWQISQLIQFKFIKFKPRQMQLQPTFEQKAIKLITVNEQGKYVLHEDGINFIQKIPKPLAVVSVAGLYRTGKSYLLNRMLLNRSNGFGVGPTVNPCTKGLWCWGSPIKGTTPDGEKCNVIVIDTEGIGALDQDQTHDTRIFTLAILSASSFIYNSVGSIDQNALQNLSLVVNLTRNIQLRSHSQEGEQEEDDPDQLATHFPSFYWVVRDFSLQLVSNDGQQITPKQYLDRALQPQKGFSDDVQEKNRIRRLLTSFFKDRECITLIRPLVDQSKLQHLDRLDFEDLRTQFVQQVLNFRRRILGRVKPKVMKGKQLDGKMYLSLMDSYVSAINDGAVPNIENAWNYMCSEQCNKILQQSYDIFGKTVKEKLQNDFPCSEQHLNIIIDQTKQMSYQFFEKNAVGDNTKPYFIQLRNRIKNKIKQLESDNEKESNIIHKSFIMKNFSSIQKKMKLGQFKSFQQFVKGINAFYINLLETGPTLPNKQFIYLDFMKKIIPQGAQIFLRNSQVAMEKLKIVSDQRIKQIQTQLYNNKIQFQQNSKTNHQRIVNLEKLNAQLEIKFQTEVSQFKIKVVELNKEKENIQQSLKQKTAAFLKKQEEMTLVISQLKKKFDLSQSQVSQNSQEWEKTKAITQLKIKQLSEQIEELKSKDKTNEIKLNQMITQHSISLKEKNIQFQAKIQLLQGKLKQLKESQGELIQKNSEFQDVLQSKQQQMENLEVRLKEQLNKKQQELLKSKSQFENMQIVMKNDIELEIESLKTQCQELKKEKEEKDQNLRNLTQQYKVAKSEYQKNQAVLEQKIQFLQINIKQTKQQNAKTKQDFEIELKKLQQQHSQSMKTIKSSVSLDLVQEYQQKIASLELESQTAKKKYQGQVQAFKKQLMDKQMQFRLKITNLEREKESFKELLNTLQEQVKTLNEKVNEKQVRINQLIENQGSDYANKIENLEEQIQQIKENAERDLREASQKSEQNMRQLKNFYEFEKQKLQSKINQERQKFQKKQKQLLQDIEERINSQTEQLKEQNQNLRNQLTNLQITLRDSFDKLQHEYDIVKRNFDVNQKENEELKERLEKVEKDAQHKLDRVSQTFKIEKQVLQDKIDEFYSTKNKYEKQIMGLNHSKEVLSAHAQKSEAQVLILTEQCRSLKTSIETKGQQFRNRMKQLQNEKMEIKVNYEKQIALVKQQNQFNSRKLKDVERRNDDIKEQYQGKLRLMKEEMSKDSSHFLEKYKTQLSNLQQKYDKLKKSSKQTEANLTKTINNHQRERGIEREKYMNLQIKVKEYEQLKSNQSELYNSQLSSLKATYFKERKDLQEQFSSLKKQFLTLENQKNQISSNYDKQKTLWQNKIDFLERNSKNKEKQYSESLNQFKANLEAVKNRATEDKIKIEAQNAQIINKMTKSHKNQIQQLKSNNTKKQSQYQSRITTQQSQIRKITEKLIFEQQNKVGSQATTQRKLKELTQIEKKLMSEIEKLKTEKVSQKNDFQKTIQRQKEKYKSKINERQQKCKQVNKQKDQLNFRLESQKAKWSYEKENHSQKIEQLKQTISNYKREVEKLQREKQKLKVEKKCNSKMQTSMHRYNNYSLEKGLSRSSFEQNSQIENRSPLGDMSGYSFFGNQQ